MCESLAARAYGSKTRQTCISGSRETVDDAAGAYAGGGACARNDRAHGHGRAGNCQSVACQQSSRWPKRTHNARLRSCDELERQPIRKPLRMRSPCRRGRSSRSAMPVAGVKTLMAREPGLQGSAAIDENRRMIVAGLREAECPRRVLTAPAGADPVLAGLVAVRKRAARTGSQPVCRSRRTARLARALPAHIPPMDAFLMIC